MGKNSNFIGQPVYGQILKLIDSDEIKRISRKEGGDKYVKKLDGWTHLVVFLYAVLMRLDSLRELPTAMMAESHKLEHLKINYLVKRSTFSDANKRRKSSFFEKVYRMLYNRYKDELRASKNTFEGKLYVMDSTTISLFSNILKGAGRNPKIGKKKGGIKAHTVINYDEAIPQVINYTSAATHDSCLLKTLNLAPGSIIAFDRAYIDYEQFERFTSGGVIYVTKMKKNLKYKALDSVVLVNPDGYAMAKISTVEFRKTKKVDGEETEIVHKARLVEYWEKDKSDGVSLITNGFDMDWTDIVEIYKRRWSIEVMYKLLKQNFPLKYFFGESVNAIQIQIWVTMIAFLLMQVVKKRTHKKWCFSNMVSSIRQCLMSYINLYAFLNDPEGEWNRIVELRKTAPPEDPILFDYSLCFST